MSVWIAIGKFPNVEVFNAKPHQVEAYNKFMKQSKEHRKKGLNVNKDGYRFTMSNFSDDGKYSSFCVLTNVRREKHILSNDENALKAYVNQGNRLTEPVGGSLSEDSFSKITHPLTNNKVHIMGSNSQIRSRHAHHQRCCPCLCPTPWQSASLSMMIQAVHPVRHSEMRGHSGDHE